MRRAFTAVVLLASACASYEVAPEVRLADWEAKNVYPESFRSEVLAYLDNYFNGPPNIQVAAISEPTLKPMGLGHRYVACVRYESKRSGAAVKEHAAIFVGGKLDRFQEIKESNKDQCLGANYKPFPELEALKR